MVVLDATIVNVALPHIQNALHFWPLPIARIAADPGCGRRGHLRQLIDDTLLGLVP
jgi:hypothetical protein